MVGQCRFRTCFRTACWLSGSSSCKTALAYKSNYTTDFHIWSQDFYKSFLKFFEILFKIPVKYAKHDLYGVSGRRQRRKYWNVENPVIHFWKIGRIFKAAQKAGRIRRKRLEDRGSRRWAKRAAAAVFDRGGVFSGKGHFPADPSVWKRGGDRKKGWGVFWCYLNPWNWLFYEANPKSDWLTLDKLSFKDSILMNDDWFWL